MESGFNWVTASKKAVAHKKKYDLKSWMFSLEGWRLLLELGCPSWRYMKK
jgi:hypothetical protein